MLTPTAANRINWFYAAGNTPATNLTRCVPHGLDADILSLGCGDLRNILFTAYVQRGLPSRKLDITCCDINERIIARNIILLTLIIDGDANVSNEALWNIYYHLYLDAPTCQLLRQQCQKILAFLGSLEDWKRSNYRSHIQFCDADTLSDVRSVCNLLAAEQHPNNDAVRKEFAAKLKHSLLIKTLAMGEDVSALTGMRSAAPLSLQSNAELPKAYSQYWNDGTVTPNNGKTAVPNPMFANLISEHEILHYGTDPILGYHLATAYAPLSDKSPLKPDSTSAHLVAAAAAKAQFSEWVAAFKQIYKQGVVLRFVVSDVYAFCHSIQHAGASGDVSANWYRRQWDKRPLVLDEAMYGKGGNGPTWFDIIDTSNLSDHFGILNMVVSVAPLLKQALWATAYTELLIKRDGPQQKMLAKILCGDAATVLLLLGLSPVQHFTNAKCESHVDEFFIGFVARAGETTASETQLHSRLAWKRDDQFSGQPQGRPKIHIEHKALCRILFNIYWRMFESENPFARPERSTAYCHFHRGGFAAFLKLVMTRVDTDWESVCVQLVNAIGEDQSLSLSSNYMQEFCVQMHLLGMHTEGWMVDDLKSSMDAGPLKGWRNIPPVVAVTVEIPRNSFNRLYAVAPEDRLASPTIAGSVRASPLANNQWHNMFSDVHIIFGQVKCRNRDTENAVVELVEDPLGWANDSNVVATFLVPTAALQIEPTLARVGICVPASRQSLLLYAPTLGARMAVFETRLDDTPRVFLSKFMPGQAADRAVCGGIQPFGDAIKSPSGDTETKYVGDVLPNETKISSLTGHVNISSAEGMDLLQDKIPIEFLQRSPFAVDVVFGEDTAVCPLKFPYLVTVDGKKTRVARASGFIEVTVPFANPMSSKSVADFMFPTALTVGGLPVALNAPHLNLDSLPILDINKRHAMRWLTTLTSFQFSAREKRLRDSADKTSGISTNLRVNFKESVFSMFMLSSGLQGGQTGLFAINHPDRGGIHMLILVSAIRLDGDTASVVLDAAVIPFTAELITSGRMESFLILIRELECCMLNVNDAELDLWKTVLASFVERCRTWNHLLTCEYKKEGASIPLSFKHGKQVICSCGNGHLPKDFITLPEWNTAAPNAVRVAISPVFASPTVEEAIDSTGLSQMTAAGNLGVNDGCRNCGKIKGAAGVALKKCTGCMEAEYCSVKCQKTDWKKHRMECKKGGL